MALSDAQVARIKSEIRRDNRLFMDGKLTHEQYWTRVHKRDALVRTLSPEDRRKING